ncbi:MAG: serine/threonine-protein kinase [Intestinibacter sp.]|uniref:serine/threonine protein kinase n=1 Tax=Intestinibacter sp. TaxID=1965304 RepID=UPI0025BDE073|nr:serine/threonine-protein kinase [Intestinibacter sp.]MCI6738365.1 serine/threonine-protein kinase [Intestinibacter sp.]
MAELKIGSSVKIEYGDSAKIISELGRGAQGVVYLVEYKGKKYALKWYFYDKLREPNAFRHNIRNNIDDKSPSDNFLWPQYLTEGNQHGSFGYLMNLIPSNYVGLTDILNTYKIEKVAGTNEIRKVPVKFQSLEAVVNAAINIVIAFRELHRAGKSYQDLNDGGFYIDIKTGDLLVCDCDNIAPEGDNFGIAGMPGYMAPEIVRGIAKPDVQTDKYSLAVVLFKLLFRHDPLEGAKVLKSVCLHEGADLKHYGKEPVFIYDPNNKSNRPVIGVHDNVIKLWKVYPDYIKDAFIRSFTTGIQNPNHRIIENEWQKLFVRLRSNIIPCECGRVRFSNAYSYKDNMYICPVCSSKFLSMQFGDVSIPMFAGQKLYQCFTAKGNYDFNTVTATIVENKKHKGVMGIKNNTNDTWKCTLPSGEVKELEPGKARALGRGMTIDFGKGVIAKL